MLATTESKNQAVSKLESLIERGRSRAANVIDHVMSNQPTDRLVRGADLQFRVADNLPHADPERLVRRRQSPARPLGVESQELLTKSKVFQDKILAGPEGAEQPA